jgi:hypothetical protein
MTPVPFTIDQSVRSPNHSDRRAPIVALVLHSGEGTRASDLHELSSADLPLTKRKSAHYYVDRTGHILQLVPDEREAWHAGESHYLGRADWNAFALGIESEHMRGQDWPSVQLQAIRWLMTTLAARYSIATDMLAAHRWIAPTRKADPSDLADLQLNDLFAASGRGYKLLWKPYRVRSVGSRVRSTPQAAGAIHRTLSSGATFWATTVRGATVGGNTTWLALRYGGYMHASLAGVATDLERPLPAWRIVRAGIHGAIALTDYRATGRAAAYYAPGTPIEVDDFDVNGYVHVAAGDGFVAKGMLE